MSSVEYAIEALQQGQFIILQDDAARENEADLVIAAEHLTAETLNFMLRDAGGFVCLALCGEILDKLNVPQMVRNNNSQFETPFTISVEAADGVTTGVSVADRLHTIKTMIADDAVPGDIVMPGHIMPLRAQDKGVLTRAGHTEGSVDLMQLSGLKKAALICELMNLDGTMMRGKELLAFAQQHNIVCTSIAEIRAYRLSHEIFVKEIASCTLPILKNDDFKCHLFQDSITQQEHIALVSESYAEEPLVRLHSQCITGDVLRSNRCDCGEQLQQSLHMLAEQKGILLYLAQEGRGIGLANKIRSYALQEQGLDTVEANHELGFSDDLREYYAAAQMLKTLNVFAVRLMTNNPRKIAALEEYGIKVTRVPLETIPTDNNRDYLLTKQTKLHHLLNLEF